MRILSWFSLTLLAGLSTAAAEEPRLWRDPDQGCTYILTPQGGVGLRFRSDGTPDCPDALDPSVTGSIERPIARSVASDMSRRPPPPVPAMGGSRIQAQGSPPQRRIDDRPQLPARFEPSSTGSTGQALPADTARREVQSFSCHPSGGRPRDGTPAEVRVRVQPEARIMLVDASGANVQRYTLDTNWDVWFNGRSERDPRLGIILSPNRGTMWLDVAVRSNGHQEFRSLAFACEPEDGTH